MDKVKTFQLFAFLLLAWRAYERVYYADGQLFVKGEAGWPIDAVKSIEVPNIAESDDEEDVAEAVSALLGGEGFVKSKAARDGGERPKARGIGITDAGRALLAVPVIPEPVVFAGEVAEA
jgi:hypothetical protein